MKMRSKFQSIEVIKQEDGSTYTRATIDNDTFDLSGSCFRGAKSLKWARKNVARMASEVYASVKRDFGDSVGRDYVLDRNFSIIKRDAFVME